MNIRPNPTKAHLIMNVPVTTTSGGVENTASYAGIHQSAMYAEYQDIFEEITINKIVVELVPTADHSGLVAIEAIHNPENNMSLSAPSSWGSMIEVADGPISYGRINKFLRINVPVKDKSQWYNATPSVASPDFSRVDFRRAIEHAAASTLVYEMQIHWFVTFR